MNRNAHFDYFNPLFLLFFLFYFFFTYTLCFSFPFSLPLFQNSSQLRFLHPHFFFFSLSPDRRITLSFFFLSSQKNHSVFEGSSLVWTCYGITPKEVNDPSTAFLSLSLSLKVFSSRHQVHRVTIEWKAVKITHKEREREREDKRRKRHTQQ